MTGIIRGTTPSITYAFTEITVSNIAEAYLTIGYAGETLIEKDLSDAYTGDNALVWMLTQIETLALPICNVTVQVNWKLNSGVRGASFEQLIPVLDNLKDEVI